MNKSRIPRGVRNNNPLNIRYVAKNKWEGRVSRKSDPDFEEFRSMRYGYRAAFVLLHHYMNLYNLHTIIDIVSRWAPQGDGNDTISYANTVSQKTGIPIHKELKFIDFRAIINIAHAMAEVENGVDMSKIAAYEGYYMAAFALGYTNISTEVKAALYDLANPL